MDNILVGLLTIAVVVLVPLVQLYKRALEREQEINKALRNRIAQTERQNRWVKEQLQNDLCDGQDKGK